MRTRLGLLNVLCPGPIHPCRLLLALSGEAGCLCLVLVALCGESLNLLTMA